VEEPAWVLPEVVLAVHRRQLAEHGGGAGVRDEGLLDSALNRPRNLYLYEPKAATPARLAASYAYGIARNHPFVDGNKRVAMVVSFLFLRINGVRVRAGQEDVYRTFLSLADGTLGERELEKWFDAHAASKQRRVPRSPRRRRKLPR
jgi:death-on-curing protein